MVLIITEHRFEDFLEAAKAKFDVHDVNKSVIPFRQYFLPPAEKTFESGTTKKIKTSPTPDKFLLFGLSNTDLEALTYLDEIMYKDFFYSRNRAASTVIGITQKQAPVFPGGDLILVSIPFNYYKVFVVTKKGQALMSRYKKYFKGTTSPSGKNTPVADIADGHLDWHGKMKELLLDPELLKNAVEWSWGNKDKIWDELGKRCLGCGNCTYVCPMCHCFSIEDKVDLDGNCSRCRNWAACTLPEFSLVAGGHNFRPLIKDRYHNWFYHKFVRGYLEYGKSQCVGCGRCKAYCTAGIDIHEVLSTIVNDYKIKAGR